MKRWSGWAVFAMLAIVALFELAASIPDDLEAAPEEYETLEIRIRAYCPCARCCGRHSDWKYATGRRIRKSDYSFAVSRDLEPYFPLDRGSLFIPGYNRPGTMSVARDRTRRDRRRQIEVLMTVWKNGKSPHRRAAEWGHKRMVLRMKRRSGR